MIAALLLVPVCVSAQTINNPSTITFTASADHNTVENTVPLLTSYEIRLYAQGQTTSAAVLNIGKPTPDATGTISFSQLKNVYTSAPAGTYNVKVAAVGPGGASESVLSDPFTVSPRAPSAPTGKPIIK